MQNQESGIDPIVECDDPNAIIGVINRLMPQLPRETRLRFNQLKLALLQEFGFEGLHEKTNGYRVSQILDTNADVNLPGWKWQLKKRPVWQPKSRPADWG